MNTDTALRKLKLVTFVLVVTLVLFAGALATAQESAGNWMYEYVKLRVNAKNIQSVGIEGREVTQMDLQMMVQPRIVGGTFAGNGDNPFQVGLLSRSVSNNANAQFCGGTLIGPNVVVTAAHCSDFITANAVQVLVGTRNLDGSGTRHNVDEIAIHPDWDSNTFDNDVAVWILSTDVENVPFATVATEDGAEGANLLATGWGRLSEGGSSPVELHRVEVPLVARANCNDSNSYNGSITDNMLCAGRDAGGIDACQGDSGGPLTRGNGNTILTGITSWGSGCARPNLFGVYTRVSADPIRQFIQSRSAGNLYQLHNTGAIWQYTNSPCNGNACQGWQMLDNNVRTRSIAAAGNALYQLHNSGAIWEYTGNPCTGSSCPGWRMLDNNSRTIAIAAAGDSLYQLHNSGAIWEYTGNPCSGGACPGWRLLDNNHRSAAIVTDGTGLFQVHNSGAIWEYTGTPCSGSSCPGWRILDNNPRSTTVVAAGGRLYQMHNAGTIWEYTGTPCSGGACPGWRMLDNNPRTDSILAAGGSLYQVHNSGAIWEYTDTPCSGNSCPGWQMLDNNPRSQAIAVSGQLYQLHNSGEIWEYTGTPCANGSCPGWQRLDNNPRTELIVGSR